MSAWRYNLTAENRSFSAHSLMDENMMQDLTNEGQQLVDSVASRHKFSTDAVVTIMTALAAGGGNQAQFNHPELGGMGQWSKGGMIMIGDMFNQSLKHRVDTLCNDLANSPPKASPFVQSPMPGQVRPSGNCLPAALGAATSTGSQNSLCYAIFPEARRLAIRHGEHMTVYDTGDHEISGCSQQQSDDQSLAFTSQNGLVRLSDLKIVSDHVAAPQ